MNLPVPAPSPFLLPLHGEGSRKIWKGINAVGSSVPANPCTPRTKHVGKGVRGRWPGQPHQALLSHAHSSPPPRGPYGPCSRARKWRANMAASRVDRYHVRPPTTWQGRTPTSRSGESTRPGEASPCKPAGAHHEPLETF